MVLKYKPATMPSTAPLTASNPTNTSQVAEEETINLLKGWPNPSLLPAKELLEAAGKVLTDPAVFTPALLYGPDEGHGPLREALGDWLGEFYGNAVQQWRNTKSRTSNHDGSQTQASLDEFKISPNRLTISGGASQALGTILSAVTDPVVTRRVWIVAPAYFLSFKIFEDAGFAGRLRAVPEISGSDEEDAAGPDVKWLRHQMELADRAWEKSSAFSEPEHLKPTPTTKFPKVFKHVIYCVPNFANPSSITTSVGVREQLVKCAQDFDALLVCDDVYDMLQWPAQPSDTDHVSEAQMPRIVDIERYMLAEAAGGHEDDSSSFGNVLSNASFSKLSAPGARVGWVEAQPKLAFQVSQNGPTKSGGAPSQMSSVLMTALVTSGILTKRINHVLQPTYARRYRSMMVAINEHLVPLGFGLPQPGRDVIGGYFLWLSLPKQLQPQGPDFVKRAESEGKVIVSGGQGTEVPGDELHSMRSDDAEEQRQLTADAARTKFTGYIRVCFAWEEEERLGEGIMRLARMAKKMMQDDQ